MVMRVRQGRGGERWGAGALGGKGNGTALGWLHLDALLMQLPKARCMTKTWADRAHHCMGKHGRYEGMCNMWHIKHPLPLRSC